MRKSWRLWAAGMALVLVLALGVGVALLWPIPSEAERKAALICDGMTYNEASTSLGETSFAWESTQYDQRGVISKASTVFCYRYPDQSGLRVFVDSNSGLVDDVFIDDFPSVPLLTRLRRTLARIFPALKE
jgi:hypothetical protein